ncbi:MAG TPA: DEAD/DEAH box helicase family protein [Polyangia bacterium]|nr:DEAD/DEAH box helicase family protein [Polyangia bacterium]
MPLTLTFSGGTLELRGLGPAAPSSIPGCEGCVWDARTACHRAPAIAYAGLRRALARAAVEVEDRARQYEELAEGARVHREPRPYQREALEAWRAAQGRGVVVLPTGAGKTWLACLAIEDRRRSALVIAPTLDLVRQWYDVLRTTFGRPVGVIGGGEYDVQALTVSTYDSAYLHMEHLGGRFGLVVFDECHHLPGAAYALAARASLAPFRLGLTATPERADGRHSDLDELVGPVVYRKDIVDLSGAYLSNYETVRLTVELSPEDRAEHDAERAIYRDFVVQSGIRMSSPSGWSDFIIRSSRSEEGRRAMQAYRRQRELAFAAPAKLDYVALLLDRHRADRVLLFTQDNATAYEVARRFLVPVITHETKVKERSEILEGLALGAAGGGYGAVSTSKVLNEGVDIPAANVAVVLSGSASVREHVQRLGRILRPQDGKHALLYELVTAGTSETSTSARRRDHSAYR